MNKALEATWDAVPANELADDASIGSSTGYDVQWRSSKLGVTWLPVGLIKVTDSEKVIPGLENEVDHLVRVRATNAEGKSSWLVLTAAVQPTSQVPTAPAAPELASSEDGLTVSWNAPNANGEPITDYDVRYRMEDRHADANSETATVNDDRTDWTSWEHEGSHRSVVITDLDLDEDDYRVQVRAYNGVGDDAANPADATQATRTGASEWSDAASTRHSIVVPPPAVTNTVTNTVTKTVTKTVYRDRSPAPAPAPAQPAIIGDSGYATAYLAVDGNSIELRVHPQAGGPASHSYAIGSYIRDADLGQTYQIVAGGKRRWVSPGSPLVYAIPWAVVNSQHTYPTAVVAAIPLDESAPSDGFLVRGQNGRIVSFDVGMWRHVPNIPTFQALGYRWCDVNAADAGFFSRIREGVAHPATSQPAQANYPSCG